MIYCFWIYDGDEKVDRKIAFMRYVETNIICRNCKACVEGK